MNTMVGHHARTLVRDVGYAHLLSPSAQTQSVSDTLQGNAFHHTDANVASIMAEALSTFQERARK